MILALALALLINAPVQAAPAAPKTPPSRLIIVHSTRGASATDACSRGAVSDAAFGAVLREAPPKAKNLTELPDADMIQAVLRSVDGNCEISVISRGVSTPGGAPADGAQTVVPRRSQQ